MNSLGSQFIGCDVPEDHFSHLVVHDHQLEETDSTLVAGVVAIVATLAPVELLVLDVGFLHPQFVENLQRGLNLLAALGANPSDQPLSQDRFDRRGDQKRWYPHVLHPRDRARSIVGVQRAKDQVPGQGCLDSNLRGFDIPDFTDKDDVGILTQNRSQARCKRNSDIMVDRDLHDPVDVVLDRILGRHELVGDFIHLR